jgi:hypothetical protein
MNFAFKVIFTDNILLKKSNINGGQPEFGGGRPFPGVYDGNRKPPKTLSPPNGTAILEQKGNKNRRPIAWK